MHVNELERINAFADAARRSMREHGIAPTPRNFAVWYEYHRGGKPDLTHVIDSFLSNRRAIDEAILEQLYENFLDNSPVEYSAIRETSLRMQDALTQLVGVIKDAGDDARSSGVALRTISAEFTAARCTVADLLHRLLSEARDMAGRSERLALQFQESTETIKKLRHNLNAAQKEAITDGLTGLYNRRHFEVRLQQAAAEAMNGGEDLALLLIDIDNFKAVNDSWGHPVGDQVIQLVASTIRDLIRDSDTAARYGGEEFAVLLPKTSVHDAAVVGNRIRMAFEGRQIIARGSKQTIGSITVSLGLALYEPGMSPADWVGRTDASLYQAKAAGRNRLVVAPEAVRADASRNN